MYRHHIHLVEGLRAIGAFSHSIRDAIFNAMIAEHMAAGFQSSVFEVLATNSAKSESSKHFFFSRLVAQTLRLP